METSNYFDVTSVREGDRIFYYNTSADGDCILDVGNVRGNNIYTDGVEVYGDNWKQYVSKYFIARVERDNKVIFEQQEEQEG